MSFLYQRLVMCAYVYQVKAVIDVRLHSHFCKRMLGENIKALLWRLVKTAACCSQAWRKGWGSKMAAWRYHVLVTLDTHVAGIPLDSDYLVCRVQAPWSRSMCQKDCLHDRNRRGTGLKDQCQSSNPFIPSKHGTCTHIKQLQPCHGHH